MPEIRIKLPTIAEAERVLSRIWCLLEQRQVASPTVSMRSHPLDQIEVILTFRSQDLADLVRNKLLVWSSGSVSLGEGT
jgi:hypothetical protein